MHNHSAKAICTGLCPAYARECNKCGRLLPMDTRTLHWHHPVCTKCFDAIHEQRGTK